MQESDCAKGKESGYFRGIVDYLSGSPEQAPTISQTSPKSHKERSHESPLFAHLASPKFKNILGFALFGYRKTPRKHQATPKKSLFLPLFSLFQPLLPCSECSHSPEMPRCSQRFQRAGVLPMLLAHRERKPTRKEERKEGNEPTSTTTNKTSQQGTQERAGATREERQRERQAHKPTKKGTPPPIGKG